jgi:hypothetical protein
VLCLPRLISYPYLTWINKDILASNKSIQTTRATEGLRVEEGEMEGFSSGAESDGQYSPRAGGRGASRQGSGDSAKESSTEGSPTHKRLRAASLDGGRDRSMSLMDADDLDSLWREVDSPRMQMAAAAAVVAAAASNASSAASAAHASSERTMDALDLTSAASTRAQQQMEKARIEQLMKVKLDPEKCLKVVLKLKGNEQASSSSRNGNHSANSRESKRRTLPLIDWDRQTPILMRRKRYDPQRGFH